MATTVVQVRVDEELIAQAAAIFEELGIDLQTAIRIFLKRSVKEGGIPFSMSLDKHGDSKTNESKHTIQEKITHVGFYNSPFAKGKTIRIEVNNLPAELFLKLYSSVGWEPPCVEQVRTALSNTVADFTAYDGEEPVGMVRLIGDGGMSFYIKDFAVVPAYQSKGVGTLLLSALEGYIRERIPTGWAVSLELISTKEAVPFYKKHGFEERPCDRDGPGMFKMLR